MSIIHIGFGIVLLVCNMNVFIICDLSYKMIFCHKNKFLFL